jgi:hypothetical protein
MQVDSSRPRNDPICHTAQEISLKWVILPVLPPPRDQVVALIYFRQQLTYVGRVILQVAVHGDYYVAVCVGESGLHRGGLAGVSPEMDALETWVGGTKPMYPSSRTVGAAIIYQQNLVILAKSPERFCKLAGQDGNIRLLVAQGYYNGDHALLGHVPLLLKYPGRAAS